MGIDTLRLFLAHRPPHAVELCAPFIYGADEALPDVNVLELALQYWDRATVAAAAQSVFKEFFRLWSTEKAVPRWNLRLVTDGGEQVTTSPKYSFGELEGAQRALGRLLAEGLEVDMHFIEPHGAHLKTALRHPVLDYHSKMPKSQRLDNFRPFLDALFNAGETLASDPEPFDIWFEFFNEIRYYPFKELLEYGYPASMIGPEWIPRLEQKQRRYV